MKKSTISLLVIALSFYLSGVVNPVGVQAQSPVKSASGFENWNKERAGCLFSENRGQVTDQDKKSRTDIQYIYNAPGFKLVVRHGGMSYEVQNETINKKEGALKHNQKPGYVVDISRVDIDFLGCNRNAQATLTDKSGAYNNYYNEISGDEGFTGIQSGKTLTLDNVWPNIDIVFNAHVDGQLEYDFIVRPGGHIDDIKLNYMGQNEITNTPNGLLVKTTVGLITENIPSTYVKESGSNVHASYKVNANTIGFSVSHYDTGNTLVIDPLLKWSTYYGGSASEQCEALVIDNTGNMYIGGETRSTNNIATTGAYQTSVAGGYDAFLAKFKPDGSLLFGTYYGGKGDEQINSLAVDSKNAVWATGYTNSTSGIATKFAAQKSNTGVGTNDAFLASFSSTGSLSYGTYFGGANDEIGYGVAIDDSDNIYIDGSIASKKLATNKGYDTSLGGNNDAFVARYDNNGNLKAATYYGGLGFDCAYGVAINKKSRTINITGETLSPSGISTAGGYRKSLCNNGSGYPDAFLAQFDLMLTTLKYGTYFGGGKSEKGYGISIDTAQNVIITGMTGSDTGIASKGAYQTVYGGGGIYSTDAFITKFDAKGKLVASTYYGGSGTDEGAGIICDKAGNIYVTGRTATGKGMATTGAFKTHSNAGVQAFISEFKSDLSNLIYGTYYGDTSWTATGSTFGSAIVLDNNNNIYAAGTTQANAEIATHNAYDTTEAGISDAYLLRFNANNTGIENIAYRHVSGIKIYPNPNNGTFTLQLPQSNADIYINNSLGAIIKHVKANYKAVDLNIETAGAYYVQVVCDGQLYAGKILVVK